MLVMYVHTGTRSQGTYSLVFGQAPWLIWVVAREEEYIAVIL